MNCISSWVLSVRSFCTSRAHLRPKDSRTCSRQDKDK
jgi:hypothetical protein